MPETPTLWIEFVDVSFKHRDIRNITDAEYWQIYHRVVHPEWVEARKIGATLTGITIETDYVGDQCRYVVHTHHEERDGSGEPADRGNDG